MTKHIVAAICLVMGVCAHPTVHADPPHENRFIVELLVRYEGKWFRLNSGPRNAQDVMILHKGLEGTLNGGQVAHNFIHIDLETGEATTFDDNDAPMCRIRD